MNSRPLPHSNLPLQLTLLVGREEEVASICALLRRDDVRLLTLTGPPGIGKTRLGIQVAAALLADFADGAFFVNLASITEPDLVIPTIVYTLGVRQEGDRSLVQSLMRYLAERQMLLLLDNFEQVVEAAPQVTEVLQAATRLKVLVTSRELLRVSGEHNFPVPPLSLPPVLTDHDSIRALAHLSSERIATYEAVQLFALRARALRPDFALTESNALTVAAICSRLDGLPLPIELAAARINHLTPQAILDRLQNRLRLLTGGTQDMPPRQRTLRATIEWSYNLLDDDEQRLFRRLAVFQGGSTLEAIEAVCKAGADLGIEVLDGATSLVDKSLLRLEYGAAIGESDRPGAEVEGEEPYYAMLETIHEYAREQLEASGEAEVIRLHHASYFLRLAQRVEPLLRGPQQADWLGGFERERDNFRAALEWSYHHDVSLGLQLAAALGTFWVRRSNLSEGQERISKMLARARDAGISSTEEVAQALYWLGFITWYQGDMQAVRPLLQESVRIFEELRAKQDMVNKTVMAESLNLLGIATGRLEGVPARRALHEEALDLAMDTGDTWTIARSLYQLGHASRLSGDHASAQSLFEESLALFRASGDQFNIGLALIGAGLMAQQRGDYQLARSLYEESLAIYRKLGVPWAIASSLYCLGSVALDQGDYANARAFLDESLTAQRELGTMADIGEGLDNLGRAAYFQGDYAAAYSFYTEGLTLFQEVGDRYGTALCLMDLAGVMITVGNIASKSRRPRHDTSGDRQVERSTDEDDSSLALPVKGAHLLGASQALFEDLGVQLNQMGQKLFDMYISEGLSQLGERAFAEALEAGRAVEVETAISWVYSTSIPREISASTTSPTAQGPKGSGRSPLTRREREIAVLLACGKSNRQIADDLVMSERTVEWHTSNILSKLGFQSRAQIAVWAVEQGLI